MTANEIDTIVTYGMLAFVLLVLWPGAVLYARRQNQKSDEARRELVRKTNEWFASNGWDQK